MSDETVEMLKLEPGTYLLVVGVTAAPEQLLARLKSKALEQGIHFHLLRVADVNQVRLIRVEGVEMLKVDA